MDAIDLLSTEEKLKIMLEHALSLEQTFETNECDLYDGKVHYIHDIIDDLQYLLFEITQ